MSRGHIVLVAVLSALAVAPAMAGGVGLSAGGGQQAGPVALQAGTTFTVNSTGDDTDGDEFDGVCDTFHVHTLAEHGHVHVHSGIRTLRACIEQGNFLEEPYRISFSIPGQGPYKVQTTRSLPDLEYAVAIDGTTQPGYAGAPLVEISGTRFGSRAHLGFDAYGTVVIRGLSITGFDAGIRLFADGVVESSYIGIDPNGSPAGNGVGVSMEGQFGRVGGSTGTTPGGPCTGACNVISGNDTGVRIYWSHSLYESNAIIEGNFIGTDPTGTVAVGNGAGVIVSTSLNTIGGVTPEARNVISGNHFGIRFLELEFLDLQPLTTLNVVSGNYIGLNAAGNAKLGNVVGIDFDGGTDHLVGGDQPGTRNVISGNGTGVQIGTLGGQSVEGNYIGLNAAGDGKVGNEVAGVAVLNSDNNLIGGERALSSGARCEGPCNVISGNDGDGVLINFSQSENNRIQGNYVGLNPQGDSALGNGGYGIQVRNAFDTTIGGTAGVSASGPCTGVCNVISGNAHHGIVIKASTAGKGERSGVAGNFIGLNPTGDSKLFGNGSDGVLIFNASNNTVGGVGIGSGNIISGNGGGGVVLASDTSAGRTSGNAVLGNIIGLGVDGVTYLGNGEAGVTIGFASGNTVGGVVAAATNIISGNGGHGVRIFAFSNDNVVQGNIIGLTADGKERRGNDGAGVTIEKSSDNTVGGATQGAGNVISGNALQGVEITGGQSQRNRLEGNWIGTDKNGNCFPDASNDCPLRNRAAGVSISDAASVNSIGGETADQGNVIAFNDGNGVEVLSGNSNSVLSNVIFFNGGQGIALGGDGITENDPLDADEGPNGLQNFPQITKIQRASTTTIEGKLEAKPGSSYRVELFSSSGCDTGDHGEAEKFLAFLETTTNAEGLATYAATLPNFTLPTNHVITATATDPMGSTSEFSMCVPLVELVGLEAVQVIQDWKNSVVLIEEKRTVVRAHIQRNGPGPAIKDVKVELHGSRGGIGLTGSPLTPANKNGGALDAETNAADRRGDLEGSFYFILPKSWTSGTILLEIESLDHALDCREAAGTPHDCAAEVTFDKSPGTIRLRFVPVSFEAPGGVTWVPTRADLARQVRIIETMFPLTRVQWDTSKTLPLGVLNGFANMHFLSLLNTEIAKLQTEDGCGTNCDTIYLGVMTAGARSRLRKLFPEGLPEEGLPAGSYQPAIGQAHEVPGNVAIGFVFSDEVHFVRKFANTSAPMFPIQYGRTVLAHELGHVLGNPHVVHSSQGGGSGFKEGFCDEVAEGNPPDFPYLFSVDGITLPVLGPMDKGEDEKIFGLDFSQMKVVDPTENFPLMSYCGSSHGRGLWQWPSKLTYEQLFSAIDGSVSASSMRVTSAQAQDYLVLRGSIDTEQVTGAFEPFSRITSDVAPTPMPVGAYSLQLLNASGDVLMEQSFRPTLGKGYSPGLEDPKTGSFEIFVPSGPAFAQAVLLHDGIAIHTRDASANLPIVRVVTPNGGEILSGESITLRWTGTDPDEDELTYTAQFSPDGGATWETLALDLKEQHLDIPLGNLAGTANGLVRVKASDGFHTSMDVSDSPFTVPNNPPEVFVFGPPNRVYAGAQMVILDGVAIDRENGRLAGTSLLWSSDRDGELASGEVLEIVANTLSDGDHLITFTAVDGDGTAATATTWIFVEASADLEVTKSAEKEFNVVGGGITYSVTVTNLGPNGTSGVVVEDALPESVTFASADSTRGTCLEADHSVSCDLGVLLAGETATILISVTTTQAGTVSNSVTVGSDAPDPAPVNNQHQSTVTVLALPLVPGLSRWGLVVMVLTLAVLIGWSVLHRGRKRSNA